MKLPQLSLRELFRLLLVVALLPLLYVLSSGPVLAVHCRVSNLPTWRVCQCYWPLFRIAPTPAGRYANWCGASDLEVFILLDPVN
jgi:hypothetical protein